MADLSAENLELLQDFVKDCRELIEDLEVSIISYGNELDNGEADIETINSIFRTFHSIKGGAGFLMLNNIQSVSHTAETLLDNIRSNKITPHKNHIELFVQSSDFIKEALDTIEQNASDEPIEEKALEMKAILEKAIAAGLSGDSKIEPVVSAEAVKSPINEQQEENEANPFEGFGLEMSAEMLEQFLSEANDLVRTLEQTFLTVQTEAPSPEELKEFTNLAYRTVHTLKGNSGFMGFSDITALTHGMESVLTASKEVQKPTLKEVSGTFIQLIDILKDTIDDIAQGNASDIEHLDLYLELIKDILPKGYSIEMENSDKLGNILEKDGAVSRKDIEDALCQQRKPLGERLVDMGKVSPDDVQKALDEQKKPLGEVLVELGKTSKETVDSALKKQQEIKETKSKAAASTKVTKALINNRQDIRVDIAKLDILVNLIGELVISNNMLAHNPDLAGLELENFSKASQQMTKIVRELQETAMTIRMVPVSGLFKRMIRLVHDLSNKSGKKVKFELFGEETEIDKTVVEIITDPLVHIIRNSLDHGIETQEKRVASGKSAEGDVKLIAKHEEGEVWIIVEDDGAGINKEKVLKKAIDNGIIDENTKLTDKEIFNLIFEPGFSTAEKITDISGRGVGMDVVKKNLEKIRGKVDVESIEGKGTRVVLRIPLTLAIIEGMRVRVGKSEYILPMLSIREFHKPLLKQITVSPDGDEVIRLREELLPVVRLHELHDIEPFSRNLEDGIIIVIESGKRSAALFVDEIIGQQQTVIKGLSEYIGKVEAISGCTILGDGGISLILDIDSFFQKTTS